MSFYPLWLVRWEKSKHIFKNFTILSNSILPCYSIVIYPLIFIMEALINFELCSTSLSKFHRHACTWKVHVLLMNQWTSKQLGIYLTLKSQSCLLVIAAAKRGTLFSRFSSEAAFSHKLSSVFYSSEFLDLVTSRCFNWN